jgi:hypothetical protein
MSWFLYDLNLLISKWVNLCRYTKGVLCNWLVCLAVWNTMVRGKTGGRRGVFECISRGGEDPIMNQDCFFFFEPP